METNNLFNEYVARLFNGYSAHTLYQFLCRSFPKEVANEWIYVRVYKMFLGKGTTIEEEIFDALREIVFEDPDFSRMEKLFLSELQEAKYCNHFGYKYNAAFLKDKALDFYIKGTISLGDFKFILSL